MTPLIIYLVYLGIGLMTALTALHFYRRALQEYRPMLIFIWVLVGVELIQTFFTNTVVATALDNVHYLAEALLVIWIAKRWNLFSKRPLMFPVLVGFILACWTVEKLVTGNLDQLSWCRIISSLVIALLGIEMMSRTLLSAPASLSRNTIYLFSMALIFSYVLAALAEIYLLILSREPSESLILGYFYFTVALNAITYILFFKSILCIPRKATYSLS